MKRYEITLPPFAFLHGSEHDGSDLQERNVILHVRSASIIEVFERNKCELKPDVLKINFTYTNRWGIEEKMVAALHYCAVLDIDTDRDLIKKEILTPAAKWYCDWAEWEDKNIWK